MYLKHTLKYCIRAPLRFFLFVVLLSLSTFLLIIQFCIYEKGSTEFERTRQTYKVIGDVSLNENKVDDLNNQFNYIFPEEERVPLVVSPYIKEMDFRYDLYGKVSGFNRIITQFDDPSDWIYLKGHVLSGVLNEAPNKTYWKLEVSVDELYYAKEDPGKIINLQIPTDDSTFDYDKLLNGTSYFFMEISKVNTFLTKSLYEISSNPLNNSIISEDEVTLSPDYYKYKLNFAKSLSAMNDAFPMTCTKDLLSIPDFFNGIATISQGRAFTKEEYKNGTKACIISQELAATEKINIGDTLNISVTDELAYFEFRNGGGYNSDFYNATFELEAAYEVIGFYKTKNINMEDPQYFSINTIFVPFNSCPAQMSPDNSPKPFYTYKTSFVLSSPDKKYELLENLKDNNFNFDKYTVTVYDQGYELIRMILKNMIDSSVSLLLITGITIILILALLVYLYLIKRKREYAIMRVMGETKNKASLIFFLGILLIGILGTLIGAVAAGKIAEEQVQRAYEVGQKAAIEEGIEGGIYSDTYIFDSGLPITYFLLPVFGIFVVLLLFCLVGYLQFRKKSLLQFISVRAET